MGILWRTDCHCGEVQVSNGMGGDGGGHWRCMPIGVGAVDEISRSDEPQKNNQAPGNFTNFTLRESFFNRPGVARAFL